MDEKKNKKLKIVVIVIICIVAVCAAYFAVNYFEQENFYNTIKKVSDIENSSDIENNKLLIQTTPSNEDFKKSYQDSVNVTSEEISMLEDLKTKLINDTLREYVDIHINRLSCEKRVYENKVKVSDAYDEYVNGKRSYSEALSLIEDYNEALEPYANKTDEYKVESDLFLQNHSDIKNRFNTLCIDEDFLFNQLEEVKIERVV